MAETKKEHDNTLVLSYLALRRAVGFLGMGLPVILVVGSLLFGNCLGFQDSISDYHNTNMRDVFVGILCAIAFFLFAYSGYSRLDFWMAKAAGILGFMVAVFPDTLDDNPCTITINQIIPAWFATVHFISAALFFLVLAYFSIFLFTKSNQPKSEQTTEKKKRNVIFKVCGYIMIACLVLLAIYFFVPGLEESLGQYSPVLVLETLALWAFGFSWLVKGEFILADK